MPSLQEIAFHNALKKYYPNLAYHLGMGEEPKTDPNDVLAGDPGFSPAGIVINPKNAKLISEAVGSIAGKGGNIEKALAYMSVKYPKLFSLPKRVEPANFIEEILNRENTTGVSGGFFNPRANRVKIYESPFGTPRAIPNIVESTGHELTHAVQMKKDPTIFNNYTTAYDDVEKYAQQVAEVFARRGGATAKKTFLKYLENK